MKRQLGWWLCGLMALACGGTTRNQPREAPNGGSSGQPDPGGAGSSGRSHAAGSGSGASSHAGSNAEPTPNGGASAAGSSGVTQPSGGAAPIEEPSNLDCDQPYFGPTAAARKDGPSPLGIASCEAIPDEVLLARYDDFKARVPTGFFYDAATQLEVWDNGCSSNVAHAQARSSIEGTPRGMYQTDWFYELEYCSEGTRQLFRSRRCDYFDGSTLSAPSPERLLFLSSLLWWAQHYNDSGAAQLGYGIAVGNATDWVEVCSLRSTRGDFGLCDELTLESTQHLVKLGGQVQLGQPMAIRTIQGQCH